MSESLHKGSCACGTVSFTVTQPPFNASACHCSQCIKMTGMAWPSAQVHETGLKISGPVKWISLSPQARRGICPDCGSFLFWQGTGEDDISFNIGTLDTPNPPRLARHIFVADKPDFYDITDTLPQRAQ